MQQVEQLLEEDALEWREFCEWANAGEDLVPFITLAFQWFAGLLTVEEGRRIETDQQLAQFLRI